jgi:hypothetical protein
VQNKGEAAKQNAIRRVVRQGSFFICGLCGTRYHAEDRAEACLEACSKRFLNQAKVESSHEKKQARYRCTYCKRVYDTVVQAKDCARHCKDDIQKKLDAESQFKGVQSREEKLKALAAYASEGDFAKLPEQLAAVGKNAALGARKDRALSKDKARTSSPAAAKASDPGAKSAAGKTRVHPAEGTKFTRDGDRFRCVACHQKYSQFKEAIACFDHHGSDFLAAKQEGQDKRIARDGAKYRCQNCKKAYFTREEAISCFDGHTAAPVTAKVPVPAPEVQKGAVIDDRPENPARARRAAAQAEGDKFFRDGAKYVCRSCNKKYFTKNEVLACYDGHVGGSSAAEPAAPSGTGLPRDDLEKTLETALKQIHSSTVNTREGEEKFYRDGAKYVCKKCGAKYFTRSDVITCFDGHS